MATSENKLDRLRTVVVTLDSLADEYPQHSSDIAMAIGVCNEEIQRIQDGDGDE